MGHKVNHQNIVLRTILQFGKHKNDTVNYVIKTDLSWMEWAVDNGVLHFDYVKRPKEARQCEERYQQALTDRLFKELRNGKQTV